jgi:hypothetical protein
MVQPAAASEVMADGVLRDIGFWPRFLLAWPASLLPRKYQPFRPESCQTIVSYWQRCDELLSLTLQEDNDNLPVLELADDAVTILAAFFEECEQRSRVGDMQPVKAFGLRASELAVRAAGV